LVLGEGSIEGAFFEGASFRDFIGWFMNPPSVPRWGGFNNVPQLACLAVFFAISGHASERFRQHLSH
jgi:hypothetical protein